MGSLNQELHIQMPRIGSANFRRPLLHLLEDTIEGRTRYLEVGVPLHKSALKGNWKEARMRFQRDNDLVRTAITGGWGTALHVAAGANRVDFVEELVKLMRRDDLELQDYDDNTAFFLAAGVGNIRIAEIMMAKNSELPKIRGYGNRRLTPLHFAVIQGRPQMAKFLYDTRPNDILEEGDWDLLFLTGVNADMYDLALEMLEVKPRLATARDRNQDTVLHLLARKKLTKSCTKHTKVLQLVHRLWNTILIRTERRQEILEIIREPSPLIFDAVLIGNFEFLKELLNIYPDLMRELDYKGRSIIHFAVEQRHARIFSLIHDIGSMKDFIVTSWDDDGNTLLHLAAKLAPSDQLNLVSGAAFQMMIEILWFKEVEKIMLSINRNICNSEDLTPSELFTRQHKNLLAQAENWMKGTANSCILVSTVIATGVFSSAFSLPGGIDDKTGTPNYLKKSAFSVFSISNAIALISSSTATLVFLSILISRYAESDFYKKLPLKLIFGLVTLFISITSMMVAFSSALFITYFHGMKLVPDLISVLAFLLIPLFVFLQFPLWYDIIYSTWYFRSQFRPNKAYALLEK